MGQLAEWSEPGKRLPVHVCVQTSAYTVPCLLLCHSRIFEILPVRIKDWQSSPCVADEKNRTALERIRHQQLLAREKLLVLDRRRRDLDVLIERAKHLTVQPDADVSDNCSSV